MAAGNFVVVRRTISQTLVPYKEVEERILQKRLGVRSTSQGHRFSSSGNVNTVGVGGSQWKDRRVTFNERTNPLERSRSEVCLRRKGSYVRETSIDGQREKREESLVRPILRRRERDLGSSSKTNAKLSRPQSDFFPEFQLKHEERSEGRSEEIKNDTPEERLEERIATLRREMISLRKQDRELYKQLKSLSEHIKDLKDLSALQGGLFVSCEDESDTAECVNTKSSNANVVNSKKSPSKITPARKESRLNIDKPTTSNSVTVKKTGVKKQEGVRRILETSFEYIGDPPCVTAVSQQAHVKKSGKLQPTTATNVSRRTSLHLEKKSMSCQFLNSAIVRKRHSFVDSSMTERYIRDMRNLDSKQKSLSMSQLKRTTKVTDVPTSDSECSTSGCYGGSSTGSEVDLERNVVHTESSADEELEKSTEDKVIELIAISKRKTQTQQHTSAQQPGQFRKIIISV